MPLYLCDGWWSNHARGVLPNWINVVTTWMWYYFIKLTLHLLEIDITSIINTSCDLEYQFGWALKYLEHVVDTLKGKKNSH